MTNEVEITTLLNTALVSVQAKNMADDIEAWDEDHDTDVVAMLRDAARSIDKLRHELSMAQGEAHYHRSMRVLDKL
jgi:hypothetical protein